MEKHPSVGAARNIGLFGMVDVVRSRSPYEPMAPTTARRTLAEGFDIIDRALDIADQGVRS